MEYDLRRVVDERFAEPTWWERHPVRPRRLRPEIDYSAAGKLMMRHVLDRLEEADEYVTAARRANVQIPDRDEEGRWTRSADPRE